MTPRTSGRAAVSPQREWAIVPEYFLLPAVLKGEVMNFPANGGNINLFPEVAPGVFSQLLHAEFKTELKWGGKQRKM
jgi:hypothetical protein